jgi:hypothetical protein
VAGEEVFSVQDAEAADMNVGAVRQALNEKMGIEVRLARDGKFYTAAEFSAWYRAMYESHSEEHSKRAWESAHSLKPSVSLALLLPNGLKLDSSHDARSISSVFSEMCTDAF